MICCLCRPVILSEEELGLLQLAEGGGGVARVDERHRACAQALVRLGYLARTGRGRYAVTAYGHHRLAAILAGDPPECATSRRDG